MKNLNIISEYLIPYPESVSIEKTIKILDQMQKCFCSVNIDNYSSIYGCFCRIPYKEKLLKVLIATYINLNDSNKKKITINTDGILRVIPLTNRRIFSNKEYNITIIEIKKTDKIDNFLRIDENLLEEKMEFK